MVLTPPKRLFDISLMKTVMYEDVKSDVEKNGYVAISHVWGNQRKYVPKGVGVTGGVTWTIPLSDPDKIFRAKNVMLHYKEKYCWFDVLCMPQNKQDEINKEIPFMGDYYAGANAVLVLATTEPVISKNFKIWYDIMADVMEKKRDFIERERKWIKSHDGLESFDISKEIWFTRLWTLQEAVMANNLILVCGDGKHVDLFNIAAKISEMIRLGITPYYLFRESAPSLGHINTNKIIRLSGRLDLTQIMVECSKRDCFKPQDKFYGALGALDYRNFPIDYEINMDDLNKAIVKYACSKGDLSWLTVGGDEGTGFVQPVYKPFSYVGWGWKEDVPGICGVRLEDEIMYINAWSFAKVICHEKIIFGGNKTAEFTEKVYAIYKGWNLDSRDIIRNMSGYSIVMDDEIEVATACLEKCIGNEEAFKSVNAKFGVDTVNKHANSTGIKFDIPSDIKEFTVVKATTWDDRNIPLIIHGNTEIGDQIMLVRMTGYSGEVLGIVVDKYFRRKGVCIYEKIEMTEEEAILRYTPQEFPL
jgi:hypothetical protein